MTGWLPNHEVEFDTWDEFLIAVLNKGGAHSLYRGQQKYGWLLSCTLSRRLRDQATAGGPVEIELLESMVHDQRLFDLVEGVETTLLRTFMETAQRFATPDLPTTEDRLAWWEIMQHHGIPTRLMDWTRSPFIGLWFAAENLDKDGEDAALWILDGRNSQINHSDPNSLVEGTGWNDFLDDRALQNRQAERAIKEHRMVPVVVEPRYSVPRVVAQQSVMTLIPNVEVPKGFAHAVFKTIATKVRIRASWKTDIERLSLSFGLNRPELFRDLDSVGTALTAALRSNDL